MRYRRLLNEEYNIDGQVVLDVQPTAANHIVIMRITDPIALVEASANTEWQYKEDEPGHTRALHIEPDWDPESDEVLCAGDVWHGDNRPYESAISFLQNSDGHAYIIIANDSILAIADNTFDVMRNSQDLQLKRSTIKRWLLELAVHIPDLEDNVRTGIQNQIVKMTSPD